MKESLRTRMMRWRFNLFPAYRRTGARITYIADDWHEVHIKLPLTWKTRNYVGTIFGGSMYAAVDPIYMVMFIKLLGPEYVVWLKSAVIHFKRPGRSTLRARFVVEQSELESVHDELKQKGTLDRTYKIPIVGEDDLACALIDLTLYFRKKTARSA